MGIGLEGVIARELKAMREDQNERLDAILKELQEINTVLRQSEMERMLGRVMNNG